MCLTMCSQQEEADRTIFVGNLDSKVKEEILFELFLQAGPLSKVRICKDKGGNSKSFGFVCFKHIDSVSYAIALLNEIRLFGRPIKLQYTIGSEVEPFEASQSAGIFSSNGLEENEDGDVIECAEAELQPVEDLQAAAMTTSISLLEIEDEGDITEGEDNVCLLEEVAVNPLTLKRKARRQRCAPQRPMGDEWHISKIMKSMHSQIKDLVTEQPSISQLSPDHHLLTTNRRKGHGKLLTDFPLPTITPVECQALAQKARSKMCPQLLVSTCSLTNFQGHSSSSANEGSSHLPETKGSNLGMKNITNKEPSLISYDLPSGNFIFPTPTGMTDAPSLFPPPFFFQGMVKTFDQQFYPVSQYSSLQTVQEQAGHWPMIPYANAVQCFLAGNQNQRNNAFQPVGGWDCKRKRQLQVSESESDSSIQKKLCRHTTEHGRKYRKHN